jgi:hypothetical protein
MLDYAEYHIWRIHRVFYIPIRVFEERFKSLGEGEDRRAKWAYNKIYNENARIVSI